MIRRSYRVWSFFGGVQTPPSQTPPSRDVQNPKFVGSNILTINSRAHSEPSKVRTLKHHTIARNLQTYTDDADGTSEEPSATVWGYSHPSCLS